METETICGTPSIIDKTNAVIVRTEFRYRGHAVHLVVAVQRTSQSCLPDTIAISHFDLPAER